MCFNPFFWGCKYTNKIRIINNNPVFQRIILLITFRSPCWYTPGHDAEFSATFPASRHKKGRKHRTPGHDAKFLAVFSASQHENQQNTAPKGHDAEFSATFPASRHEKGRKHRTPGHDAEFSADFPASQHDNQQNTVPKGHDAKFLAVFSASRHKKGQNTEHQDTTQSFLLISLRRSTTRRKS